MSNTTTNDSNIQFAFKVTEETNTRLNKMALKLGGTRTDVISKAISVLEVFLNAKDQGKSIGIVAPGERFKSKISTHWEAEVAVDNLKVYLQDLYAQTKEAKDTCQDHAKMIWSLLEKKEGDNEKAG